MDNTLLHSIFKSIACEISGENGRWQFKIKDTSLICMTDQLHNRMRIICPIMDANELSHSLLRKSMEANFHSALDVRYCISDNILWAAFIHPLKELTSAQVDDAILQVYSAANTFGKEYSSGSLIFPTKENRSAQSN